MVEFTEQGILELTVPDREVDAAFDEVQSRFDAVEVDVTAGDTSMPDLGSARSTPQLQSGRRGPAVDRLDRGLQLDETRNELLERILDVLNDRDFGGGGGSGGFDLPRLPRLGFRGLIGGLGGAVTLVGAAELTSTLENFSVDLPNSISVEGVPDAIPVEDLDPLPIEEIAPLAVEAVSPIPVDGEAAAETIAMAIEAALGEGESGGEPSSADPRLAEAARTASDTAGDVVGSGSVDGLTAGAGAAATVASVLGDPGGTVGRTVAGLQEGAVYQGPDPLGLAGREGELAAGAGGVALATGLALSDTPLPGPGDAAALGVLGSLGIIGGAGAAAGSTGSASGATETNVTVNNNVTVQQQRDEDVPRAVERAIEQSKRQARDAAKQEIERQVSGGSGRLR